MYLMTPDDFDPWVGRQVRVNTVPEPVDITLVGVERRLFRAGMPRAPFILWFQSPFEVYLLDDSYEMDCGRGGPHRIHISQMQPRDGVRIYQAVFH